VGNPSGQTPAEVAGCLGTLTGAEQFCAIRSHLGHTTKHDINPPAPDTPGIGQPGCRGRADNLINSMVKCAGIMPER
jgi:hypothetical protein